MSEIFNIKRFAGYAAKTYRENARKYLMYALLVLCMQVGFMLLSKIGYSSPMRVMFYMGWSSLILGVLFVFSEMRPLRNRHTASIQNTFPVSYLEKFGLIVVNTYLMFLIVYWGIFFLVSLGASGIFGYGNMTDYWLGDGGAFHHMKFMIEGMMLFIAIAIFAGTTNIKSHLLAFLIVAIVAIPLLGSTVYLPWFLNSHVFEGIEFSGMFNGISATVKSGNTTMEYTTAPAFGRFFNWWSGQGREFYIWQLLLLVTAYFKLKERQVK
jgi:hypothetical protein